MQPPAVLAIHPGSLATKPSPTCRYWGIILLTVLAILWIVPGIGAIMHESDQAAALDGSWKIALGAGGGPGSDFYNYDKLFLTYWLVGAVLWVARLVVHSPNVLLLGNAVSSLVLWSSLAIVLRKMRWNAVSAMIVGAITLAPAYLMHAPYLAPAFISAGCIMALYAVIRHSATNRSAGRIALAAALAFCAVGSRADAVLLMPFLVWLTLAPLSRPLAFLRRPLFYALLAASVAALAFGKWLQPHNDLYGNPPAFQLKVFAAYCVFGLGGASLIILWIVMHGLDQMRRTRNLWRRFGWAFGLLAYAIPFAFYASSLLSTRYWTAGLTATLLFCVSRRGRALLLGHTANRLARGVATAAFVCAIVPLFIGVQMPFPSRPRLVLRDATVFPSADGMLPMGAYLAFDFLPLPPPDTGIHDHSQAIWLAARDADFQADETGTVPILDTPMADIVELGALMQGKKVSRLKQEAQSFYADSRSLIKWSGGIDTLSNTETVAGDFMTDAACRNASPTYRGVTIYHLDRKSGDHHALSDDPWRYLRLVYSGDDFRIRRQSEVLLADGNCRLPLREGKTLTIAAKSPFSVVTRMLDGQDVTTASHALAGVPTIQVITFDGRQSDAANLRFVSGQPVPDKPVFAESILPDYMSLHILRRH